MLVHVSTKPFRCQTCSKNYTQKGALQAHVNRVHVHEKSKRGVKRRLTAGARARDDKALECSNLSSLESLMTSPEANSTRSTAATFAKTCRVCKKHGFESLKALKMHLISMHGTSHAFACECGQTFYFQAFFRVDFFVHRFFIFWFIVFSFKILALGAHKGT